MAVIVSSIGLKGIEGYRVDVEVQLLPGVEGVNIVGLPDASVKESKDRVVAALYVNDCEKVRFLSLIVPVEFNAPLIIQIFVPIYIF
ncbi:Subunit ChlI of Mg-chelatase [Lentibacillus persicus]|uniref:Subunit ChlI of Mg-chelatase n=1 Tax=Lentibacillus persicus TaxID=640948 RepID=A0A1I1VZF7_9BACI|nr:Subunit ChlI of Mg-chelatase [Lentibacillus persicus]